MKKLIRFNKMESFKIQTNHIAPILEGFVEAATTMNVVNSFRNAGINRILEKVQGSRFKVQGARCKVQMEK
jgi:hypothetical protein